MRHMLLFGFGEDQDVVKIDNDKDINDIREGVIHEVLELGRRVAQSKRHNTVFKETIFCLECCLPFITWFNPDKVISGLKIQGGKVFSAPEFLNQSLNQWEWVRIFDSVIIQCAIINAHPPFAILLWDKDHRR